MADETDTGPADQGPTDNTAGPGHDGDAKAALLVLDSALQNVDWGYQNLNGNERDLGHKSYVTAEKAFILAHGYDDKAAAEMYEKYAHRPPKEDLVKRAVDAKALGKKPDINDLTAGINGVGAMRELNAVAKGKEEQQTLEGRMGGQKVAMGDAFERSISHRKAGTDQLLGEDKHRDDGMHVFQAFRRGMRAADEYRNMVRQRKRHSELSKEISGQGKIHNALTAEAQEFKKSGGAPGGPRSPTTGPTGRVVAKFKGAFDKARDVMKKPSPTVGQEPAKEDALMGKKPKMGMAAAAEAIRRSMGQGPGMGM